MTLGLLSDPGPPGSRSDAVRASKTSEPSMSMLADETWR